MGLYDATTSRALAAISKKGATITFGDPVTGEPVGEIYDPLTDTWSGGTAGIPGRTSKAVQIPGDPNRFLALKIVPVNPVTLLVAGKGLTITPIPGMRFTWGGTVYTIVDADDLAPDGTTVILWTITGSV